MPRFSAASVRRNGILPQTPIRRGQFGQRSPSTYTTTIGRSPVALISSTAVSGYRKRTIMDFKAIFDTVEGCLAWRFKDSYDSSMFMHFWIHMQNQLKCVREQDDSRNWKALPPTLRQHIRDDALNEFPNLNDFENLWLVDAVCTAIMQNRQSNEKRLAILKERRHRNQGSMSFSRRAPEQNRGLIPGFKGQRHRGIRRNVTHSAEAELSPLFDADDMNIQGSSMIPSPVRAVPTLSRTLLSQPQPIHDLEGSSLETEDPSDIERQESIDGRESIGGQFSIDGQDSIDGQESIGGQDSIDEEPLENGGKCTQRGCNNLRLKRAGRGWRMMCSRCCDAIEESYDALELSLPRALDRNSRGRSSTQKNKEIQKDALTIPDIKQRRSDRVGIRERNRADARSRNLMMEASQSQR
ncbi:uncharacterized protein Bfra_011685 [Botrytis fragariae]|uniref:Uncharacterized protein n=1 Tax=Botrytis fragariae TaxID=1964551 RepID=A0A8H6AKJ1_9HELO|nr:uncharacterized protein Bfra_012103 [Botrytis fragariae]XP_037188091.1 uncharacterized protein Bfra_011685 [Botrytis fragariae]KAF5868772.1 hypothetical protein Bfra_012103 [Botrytis fragariae]KAF5869142.1 hypothetical protein Bfra_011685 [Botrytis fragariae]